MDLGEVRIRGLGFSMLASGIQCSSLQDQGFKHDSKEKQGLRPGLRAIIPERRMDPK